MIRVSVDHAPIDIGTEMAGIEETGAGAVASFTGIVRADDGVTEMALEHYPGMTEAVLCDLAEQAMARWGLLSVVIVHRVGPMVPGDRVVLIATASAHRREALEACAFLIDQLKTEGPFWKHETRGDRARWVEARASDDQAAARWTGPDGSPD